MLVAFSEKRRILFLGYSAQKPYVVGGVGGLWMVNIDSGTTTQLPWPAPEQQFIEGDYDDLNDVLVATANTIDQAGEWQRKLLMFKFDGVSPAPPARKTRPAWMSGMVRAEWREIPKSAYTRNIPEDHFADLGLPLPSKRPPPFTGVISYGTNFLGIPANHPTKFHWNNRYFGYHGMATDPERSVLHIGGGDAACPDNTYHGFWLAQDTPEWRLSVKGTHSRYYKHTVGNDTPPPAPAGFSNFNDENYYGTPRGGHKYWNQFYNKKRNKIIEFYCNQFWPRDEGNNNRVHTADLTTMEWERGTGLVASLDLREGDGNHWKWDHAHTGDVYMFRGNELYVWRNATNSYEVVYRFRPLWGDWGLTGMGGSINSDDNYILLEGNAGPDFSRKFAVLDLNKPDAAGNLATMIPMDGLDGPAAASIIGGRYWPNVWVHTMGRHLFYADTGVVYQITRIAPNRFNAEVLPTTGRGPAGYILRPDLGGVMTKWNFLPGLDIMVFHSDLRGPIYALGVM